MSQETRLCFIGIPKTGKTTYIAALWAYLRAQGAGGEYRIKAPPADTSYLNSIAIAWAEGSPMPRSVPEVADHIEFTISVRDTSELTIVLPDLPGEVFLNAVRRPLLDERVAQSVLSSDLWILFLNGQTCSMFEALGDHPPAPTPEPDAAEEGPDTSGPTVSQESESAREFNISELDSDTLTTELLGRLEGLAQTKGVPPIAIAISAWDVHDQDGKSPSEWLRANQPMLFQYVQELARRTPVVVYGVSAQGADYQDRPDIVEVEISDRAWGRSESGEHTDIAGPLMWHHSNQDQQQDAARHS